MPRPAKGSEEAKVWGEKMKKAREAKKQMTGGMMETHTHPDGTVMTGKKHTKFSKIISTDKKKPRGRPLRGGMMEEESDDELAELTANMTMKDDDKPSSRPSVVPPQLKKPVIIKRDLPTFDKIKTEPKKRVAETQITKGKGAGPSTPMSENERRIERLEQSLDIIQPRVQRNIDEYEQNPTAALMYELNRDLNNINSIQRDINRLSGIVDNDVPTEYIDYFADKSPRRRQIPQAIARPVRGNGMKGGNLGEQDRIIATISMLFGGIGLLIWGPPLIDALKARIAQARQVAAVDDGDEGTEAMTEMSENRSEVSDLEAQGEVRDAESTTGGKIKIGKAFKKIGRSFDKAGKDLTKGFAKVGTNINPVKYALENKKISNLMNQSGKLTNNYLLPAAVSAGLPLYYGAAGTAGMMLGGPLGALAATKAADTLWQEAVVKKGYDPRERQKSKVLGAISEKIGQAGAAQFKAGTSSGKEKKMTGKGYYLSPGMTTALPTNKRNLKRITKGGSFSSTILDLMPR
jgi:hypothetical protein